MQQQSPRKVSPQSREEKGIQTADVVAKIKEFYRQKRICRILKIRHERVHGSSGFGTYLIGVFIFPGLVTSLFRPVTHFLPAPLSFLVNGFCVLIGIEILDWILLKKFREQSVAETNADLQSCTATELIQIEDELFEDLEMNEKIRSSAASGRFVLTVLTVFWWCVTLFALTGVFKKLQGNPLSIFVYVGALGVGGGLAHLTWRSISKWGRFSIRTAMHYWPVVLYVILGFAFLIKNLHTAS